MIEVERLRPMRNLVVIRRDKPAGMIHFGGIESSVESKYPLVGTVVSCGPDCKELKVDDTILFSSNSPIQYLSDQSQGDLSLFVMEETTHEAIVDKILTGVV